MPQNRTQNSNRNALRDSETFRTASGASRDYHRTPFQNRVIELPNASRYRFFPESWRKMAHANFSHWNTLAPPALRSAPRLGSLLPRRRVASSRKHAFHAAPRPHGRLLLPLRGIQSARRLRENVRVQEICVPLVDHQLRQTSHEHSAPRFQCRPAIPASTPHRTRPPVALTTVRAAIIGRRSTAFRVERFRIPRHRLREGRRRLHPRRWPERAGWNDGACLRRNCAGGHANPLLNARLNAASEL